MLAFYVIITKPKSNLLQAVKTNIKIYGIIVISGLGFFSCLIPSFAGVEESDAGLKIISVEKRNNSENSDKNPIIINSKERTSFPLVEELNVRSKSQKYDSLKNRFIAEGSAKAYFSGYLLKADRIELYNDFQNLYAKGKVRLKKGNQYLQASSLRYDFNTKKIVLKDVYGILNINSSKSFYDSSNFNDQIEKNSLSDKANIIENEMNTVFPEYSPINNGKGNRAIINDQKINSLRLKDKFSINASLGGYARNIKSLRLNKGIDRFRSKRFIEGTISTWRIQSDSLSIENKRWIANRINFTNDPLTPAQVRIEAFDVEGNEDQLGDLLIQSKRSRVILEDKIKIPFLKRKRIKNKKEENRWIIGIDNKDRDGFYLGYNLKGININEKYKLFIQPQFLFQRLINGGTNSYIDSKDSWIDSASYNPIQVMDLFAIDAKIKGLDWGWNIDLDANISSLNVNRLPNASRAEIGLNRDIFLPIFEKSSANLFAAYRYRVWNGSLGETDVYSAFGGFLEKKGIKKSKPSDFSYILRVGLGSYQGESLDNKHLISLYRSNIYGSINTNYPIWRAKSKEIPIERKYRYSSIPINSGLFLNATIDASSSLYENGNSLNTLGFKIGPRLTVGTLKRKFLDYTKLAITLGSKYKQGQSPFNFDEAIDLSTVSLGLAQQIYGPLILNSELEFNIDRSSNFYGNLINSKFEIRWQRRAYDFGIYYNPNKQLGGLTFRLNDFDFKGLGIPYTTSGKL